MPLEPEVDQPVAESVGQDVGEESGHTAKSLGRQAGEGEHTGAAGHGERSDIEAGGDEGRGEFKAGESAVGIPSDGPDLAAPQQDGGDVDALELPGHGLCGSGSGWCARSRRTLAFASLKARELQRTRTGIREDQIQLFEFAKRAEDVDECSESAAAFGLEILECPARDTGLVGELCLRGVLVQPFPLDPGADIFEDGAGAHGWGGHGRSFLSLCH